jgi:hypothetical protein
MNQKKENSSYIEKALVRIVFLFFMALFGMVTPHSKEKIEPCNAHSHVNFFVKEKWICGRCGKVDEESLVLDGGEVK